MNKNFVNSKNEIGITPLPTITPPKETAVPVEPIIIKKRLLYFFYDDDYNLIRGSEKYLYVAEDENVPNATNTWPPNYYKAKFNPQTQEWYESATQEEITEILAKGRFKEPKEPSETQLLGQQITDLELADIIKGQQITDLEIATIIQGQQITDMELKILIDGGERECLKD